MWVNERARWECATTMGIRIDHSTREFANTSPPIPLAVENISVINHIKWVVDFDSSEIKSNIRCTWNFSNEFSVDFCVFYFFWLCSLPLLSFTQNSIFFHSRRLIPRPVSSSFRCVCKLNGAHLTLKKFGIDRIHLKTKPTHTHRNKELKKIQVLATKKV